MDKVMKILRRLILSLGAVFLALLILSFTIFVIVKHLKIKEIVEEEIEHSLGINVSINKIEFSPLLAHIGVGGITVHNPAGFAEGELAYIESVHFVFDPLEILIRKKPNIYLFTLDLQRLNIIKNKEGKVNIKELIPIKEKDISLEAKTPFYFDVFVLSVGEVKYIDYSSGSRKERAYPIGIKDAAFIGLKDENAVVKMVVYKALENTDIAKLINLTIAPVVSQITDAVGAAWGTAKSGAKGVWGIATLPFEVFFGKK